MILDLVFFSGNSEGRRWRPRDLMGAQLSQSPAWGRESEPSLAFSLVSSSSTAAYLRAGLHGPPCLSSSGPSHLIKLVKLLITILSNILFEPLNQEKKKQCTLL